jgi:flagellar hook-length control protein FliK
MVQNHAQQIELKVNPPHLGPLEVHVSLQQEQASVTFFSSDTAVRDALQSTLPQLRELLDGQGMQLHHATVAGQSLARQQQGSGGQPFQQGRGTTLDEGDSGTDPEVAQSLPRQRLGIGIVDHYV